LTAATVASGFVPECQRLRHSACKFGSMSVGFGAQQQIWAASCCQPMRKRGSTEICFTANEPSVFRLFAHIQSVPDVADVVNATGLRGASGSREKIFSPSVVK